MHNAIAIRVLDRGEAQLEGSKGDGGADGVDTGCNLKRDCGQSVLVPLGTPSRKGLEVITVALQGNFSIGTALSG